jgi:hypothetical protein
MTCSITSSYVVHSLSEFVIVVSFFFFLLVQRHVGDQELGLVLGWVSLQVAAVMMLYIMRLNIYRLHHPSHRHLFSRLHLHHLRRRFLHYYVYQMQSLLSVIYVWI